MKKIKQLFGIILGILLTFSAWAATPAQSLTAILSQWQSMQAVFHQTITDGHGVTLQESQGTMALQRPGKFRWETTQPNQQLIIADGKMLWIYDKDLQQITKQKITKAQNSPGLLLSDSVSHLVNAFAITSVNNQPFTFSLRPVKKDQALFKKVNLYFSSNNQLQKMLLFDALGQQTAIEFSQVKINPVVAETFFQFHAPANISVINTSA